MQAHGFKDQVVALAIENDAHLDDDLGNDDEGPVYYIKEKEGQSAKVTMFFRMANQERRRMTRTKSWHHKFVPMSALSFFPEY